MNRRHLLATGGVLAGSLIVTAHGTVTAVSAPIDETAQVQPPRFSVPGGRHTGPVAVRLTADPGHRIHYTLDGSRPTLRSPRYAGPVMVTRSANLTAIAVTPDGRVGPAGIEGYLIKGAEAPSLSFVVMSDIETTVADPATQARWNSYFATLTAIQTPDLIISNGDQIADNHFNTGHHHTAIHTLLSTAMAEHGLTGTTMLMTFGNHDDRLPVMTGYYPREWFPHDGGGYYEHVQAGHHFLIVNTEAYTTAHRTWLQQRLAAISAAPGALNRPIFVVGHRPLPGTINDGDQSSNPALAQDLAAHPQVIYISGHSHLNLNSEKSIHQGAFTTVNDGSMSYTQIRRDAYQIYPGQLIDNFTLPVPQAITVEVYPDRVEIDRITFADDQRRTYTNGVWDPYPHQIPAPAGGALAGPTWTVRLTGSTPDRIRANFTYTAERQPDRVPPTRPGRLTVVRGEDAMVLQVPQARDNDLVYGYRISVTDSQTGAPALPLRAGTLVAADFFFAPRPAVLEVPLSVQQGLPPGSPRVGLQPGRSYRVSVAAVDVWGNSSPAVTTGFVAR